MHISGDMRKVTKSARATMATKATVETMATKATLETMATMATIATMKTWRKTDGLRSTCMTNNAVEVSKFTR